MLFKTAILTFLSGCAVIAVSISAVAAPECTDEPQSKWIKESDLRTKVEGMGYKIWTLKISGSCYQIYGKNKSGKKVDLFFNPVSGDMVKS